MHACNSIRWTACLLFKPLTRAQSWQWKILLHSGLQSTVANMACSALKPWMQELFKKGS